jgi:orotidine-5'-phosphate decarboxylase
MTSKSIASKPIAPKNRILCALDTVDINAAASLARELAPHVGGVKLGLEFFGANGPEGFKKVAKAGMPIFLDLKLYDIPNTVAKAIKSLMPLTPIIMTIHTSGGPEMMIRAANAATETAQELGCARPIIVGVTILTSMDESNLSDIGYGRDMSAQVLKLAKLAKDSGLDGVVCSPLEIKMIKEACGEDFILVVPGIRPAGSDAGDQKRIMTPAEAIKQGADYLVIGRPITQADDPVKAAQAIAESLTESLA